jgi:hypothetical protein
MATGETSRRSLPFGNYFLNLLLAYLASDPNIYVVLTIILW